VWAGLYGLVTISPAQLDVRSRAAIPSKPTMATPSLRPVVYCLSCNAASHSKTCGYCLLSGLTRQAAQPADIRAALAEARLCTYCGEGLPCVECVAFAKRTLERQHIEHAIRVKYAKVLRVPEWDRTELRDLAPLLREAVLVTAQACEVVKARLQFSELARAYGL
jgi:hypothetical protein